MPVFRRGIQLFTEAAEEFIDDQCPRLAASLSYYTIFSIPPILILLLVILGAVMDPEDVRTAVHTYIRAVAGATAAEQVQIIAEQAKRPDAARPVASLLGLAAVLFGATSAFAELQAALNRAWEVQPDPRKGGFRTFIVKRVFSFGVVLGVAFLLLVSLVLSALLSAFGDRLAALLPWGVSETVLQALNAGLSFLVIGVLFAAIYKLLPDAVIAWRDVWVGALVTALLFVAGKAVIGLYLGRSNPGDAYGAAGSLAVVLIWVYYSSMILLFGAEFTQAWAEQRGRGIRPQRGAVRVRKAKHQVLLDP